MPIGSMIARRLSVCHVTNSCFDVKSLLSSVVRIDLKLPHFLLSISFIVTNIDFVCVIPRPKPEEVARQLQSFRLISAEILDRDTKYAFHLVHIRI